MPHRRRFLATMVGCRLGVKAGRFSVTIDDEPGMKQRPQVLVPGVTVELPLLGQLYRFEEKSARGSGLYRVTDLHGIGLILQDELKTGGYWCSPKNALTFASTGGDGDHYSLLIRDGRIDDKSPVVLTRPAEGTQHIVGESLHDFLCFGMHGGYFQIIREPAAGRVRGEGGHWFYDDVEEDHRLVLQKLAKELKLKPWSERDRREKLARLEKEFLPQVIAETSALGDSAE
jgi:hypothetical protein